jgi:hypothetical protein
MLCSLSTKLGAGEMAEITRLEKELGYPLLAFSCYSAQPAALTAEQLAKVKGLESSLGVSLVAVKA